MVSRSNSIEVVINAKDNASKVFEGVAGNIQSIGKAALAITGTALVGATTGLVALGTQATKTFADFEKGMNEVFTLLPNISGQAMKEMENQVLSFNNAVGRTNEDTIPALYQALSAGVPQDNVFSFLELANKAAVGGATDLVVAVDGITSAVNAYGSNVLDATQASDLMFTAVRLGKTTFDEMAASLYNVTPTAASLGVAFEDVNAAIATITSQGVPTSVTTTMLRQAFVELGDAGTEVAKVFEKASGKSFKEFIAAGGNTADAMAILEKEAAKLGIGVNELFGSVEAGNAALGLTGANMAKFVANTEEMNNAAGATDKAFQQMNQGIQMSLNRLNAKWQSFLTRFGAVLAPILTPMIDMVGDFVENIGDAFGTLADLLDPSNPNSFFAKLQSGVPLFNAVASTVARFLSSMGISPQVFEPVSKAIGNLINGFDRIGMTIGWFINDIKNYGIAEAINGLFGKGEWERAESSLEGIIVAFGIGRKTAQDLVSSLWVLTSAITNVGKVIWGAIAPIITWFQENVKLQDVLMALGIAIASVVIPAIAGIVAAFAPVIITFGLLVAGIALLRKAWESNFLGIRDIVANVINKVVSIFTKLYNAFQLGIKGFSSFKDIFDETGNVFTAFSGAVSSFVGNFLYSMGMTSDAALGIRYTMQSVFNAIGNTIAKTIGFIREVFNILVYRDFKSFGSGLEEDNPILNFFFELRDIVANTLNFITNAFNAFRSGGFSGLFDFIVESAKSVNWVELGTSIINALAGAISFGATWAYDNLILPLWESAKVAIASVNWIELGTSIINLLASAISFGATWAYDNIILPLWNSAKSAIETVDWAQLGTDILTALGTAISFGATWAYDNLILPLWESAKVAIASVDWVQLGTDILTGLGTAISTLGDWATWAYDNLLVPLFDSAKAGIESIDWAQVGSDIVNAIGNALKTAFDFVAWIVDSIFNPVTENAEGASTGIDWISVGNTILNAIGSALKGAFDFIKWLGDNVFGPMLAGAASAILTFDWSSIGTNLMNAIKNALPNIVQWVTDNIINPIKNALAGFNPMDAVGGAVQTGGGLLNQIGQIGSLGFQRLTGRQFGGKVIAGKPYVVGEKRPELFVPNQSGNVFSSILGGLASMAKQAGAGNLTSNLSQSTPVQMAQSGQGGQGNRGQSNPPLEINMYIGGGISDKDARETSYKLKRELQANGFNIAG